MWKERFSFLENTIVTTKRLRKELSFLFILCDLHNIFTYVLSFHLISSLFPVRYAIVSLFYRYDVFFFPSPLYFCSWLRVSSFCKFSILTLCQVEGRRRPGVNCTACDGWRKAQSNFHTISLQGPLPLLPSPVGTSNEKRNHHLTASQTAWRRLGEKSAARGKEKDVIAAHPRLAVRATQITVIATDFKQLNPHCG